MERPQGAAPASSHTHRPPAAQGWALLPAPLPPSRLAPTRAACGTALLSATCQPRAALLTCRFGLSAKIKPLSGGSEPVLRLSGSLCLCFLHSLLSPR